MVLVVCMVLDSSVGISYDSESIIGMSANNFYDMFVNSIALQCKFEFKHACMRWLL